MLQTPQVVKTHLTLPLCFFNIFLNVFLYPSPLSNIMNLQYNQVFIHAREFRAFSQKVARYPIPSNLNPSRFHIRRHSTPKTPLLICPSNKYHLHLCWPNTTYGLLRRLLFASFCCHFTYFARSHTFRAFTKIISLVCKSDKRTLKTFSRYK